MSSRQNARASKEKPLVDKSKQAKPNLQPARVIKKKDENVSPAPVTAVAAGAEELPVSQNKVTAAPADKRPHEDTVPTPVPDRPPKEETSQVDDSVLAATISPTEEPSAVSTIHLPPSVKKLRRRRALKKFFVIFTAVVLLGAAGAFIYLRQPSNTEAANRQLIAEVGKRVVVPSDETPAITTVVDETQVSQEFLRGTKKGDKVLLYFQSGRAVVYRPSSGQVVNMGPIETPIPRVFLRNGSKLEHVNAVINKLKNTQDFILSSRDEAVSKSYDKTIVVDVTGVRPDMAKRLADTLKATVGSLPEGESRPDADLLVIVGTDQVEQRTP